MTTALPMQAIQVLGPGTERVEVVGQQQRIRTRPGCGKRGLGAGVAAADDNDIETGGIEHGRGLCCGAVSDREFYVRSLINHRIAGACPVPESAFAGVGKGGGECAADHGWLPAPAISSNLLP
jgi:hypothetical protein